MNRVSLALCALVLLSVAPLAAVEQGSAEGSLTVNGKAIAMRHAYAFTEPGAGGDRLFVRVVLADQAIGDRDLATFPDSVLPLIHAGKLHALRFLIIDGQGTLDATDVFDAAGMPTIKTPSRLALESFGESGIVGRLRLDKPQKLPEWNLTLDYDLKFSAAIRPGGD